MMLRYLALVMSTLWVGGLWITGLSANSLFKVVADRSMAGDIAGHLFTTISYIGIASALYLLTYCLVTIGRIALRRWLWWLIVAMLVLILLGQFVIQPWLAHLRQIAMPSEVMQSQYASQFAAWHGVAGVLYLLECVFGLLLVIKLPSWHQLR